VDVDRLDGEPPVCHGDVGQVLPDLIAALRVVWIIGGHFNGAAILGQPEMMGGLFMREAHLMIAAAVHPARADRGIH